MRLRTDRRAIAAVELALLAPVLVTMLFGTYELIFAFRLQARLNTAVGTLAELVANAGSVVAPSGSLADMCTGAGLNLLPFTPAKMSASVASLTNDHPSNRVAGSTDALTVNTYVDWENHTSCTIAASPMGSTTAFSLADTPRSLLTKTGASAGTATSGGLQYGYSAIIVTVSYQYTNLRPFLLGNTLTLQATSAVKPRGYETVTCFDAMLKKCPASQ